MKRPPAACCNEASPERFARLPILCGGRYSMHARGCRFSRGVTMERKKASDFPPEVLKLFDGYVHGWVSRREFLDGASKFAVGGFTAAAMLESLRPNYAFAQQVAKDDPHIKTEYLTYASPQGSGTMRGYFAKPANPSGKLPGILVIHENRGLN